MVNKAIEEMVCANHGEALWESIKERAGVDVEVFVSNEAYDDAITYRLVGAASELTHTPAEQILEAFGEQWVLNAAREGYGAMLDAGGENLRDFLVNLPNFHTRVVMIYPRLQPPEFKVTDVAERSLVLHYNSHRAGLTPFVIGLVRGLGKMFGIPVQVSLLESRERGADHDSFSITW